MAKRMSRKDEPVTVEQFNTAMAALATADAEIAKINAVMDKKITAIREQYADVIKAQQDICDAEKEVVFRYAKENKEVLFGTVRHITTPHGDVGFRLGTPALKTLPKWTWEGVLKQLKTVLPDYVRTIEEVDKDRLILDRQAPGVAEHLNECGVYVIQTDSVYVKLKKEDDGAA